MEERDRESGQLQASAALAPRKILPLPIDKAAAWPPLPVRTLQRRGKPLTFWKSEHVFSVVQSVA